MSIEDSIKNPYFKPSSFEVEFETELDRLIARIDKYRTASTPIEFQIEGGGKLTLLREPKDYYSAKEIECLLAIKYKSEQ
jgi:hypothetical protein